jgi:hypothetical protein
LINNRQSGRRRGRGGGQRPPNTAPNGNRQDNRSRGNAAQLLEKYKALARDSQLAGDRVQTEYFLQFAEHYFRVLNEHRARFEEQNRGREDYGSDEDEDQDEAMNASDDREDGGEQSEAQYEDRGQQRQGRERAERDRGDRDRGGRERTNGEFRPRRERFQRANGDEPREERNDREERISLEVLPPAIAPVADLGGDEDAPKAPRRRTRRPRTDEGEAEIAPAA